MASGTLLAAAALAGASAQTALPGSVVPVIPCPAPARAGANAGPAPPAIPSPAAAPISSAPAAPHSGSPPSPVPPAPLAVNGSTLQLNVGMCARLLVSGGTGPYSLASTLGDVAVSADSGASFLSKGLRNGYDTLTLADARGATIRVPVLVAPDAGVLPASLALQLAGRPPPSFAASALDGQLLREARLRPGATIAATDPRALPAPTAGAPVRFVLPVTLAGQNLWRDVQGVVPVQLQLVDLPRLEPALLFFSDDPENVRSDQTGVLFRAALPAQTGVRLFTYSQLEGAGQRLYVVLQSKGTSHVQILGDVAGPGFFNDVGHKVSVRYLSARHTQQSIVVPISLGDPAVLAVGGQSIEPSRVVSAIFDLLLLDGDPVDAIVVACAASDDPLAFAQAAPNAAFEDSHFRAGVYPLDAEPPIMLSAAIGTQFSTPPGGTSVLVGSWAIPPIVGKRYLIGDYGVVRPLRITLTNVSPAAQAAYLYEVPSPNGVTTTVFFDGDAAPLEVPCLQAPATAPARYLIRKINVPPGGTPVIVTGEYMTDGGSAYPVELGLTSSAPLDPPVRGNCSPAIPAPPSTTASPTP